MKDKIKKLVVVGGGTAGWMSAALLKRVLAAEIDVELVESDDIGIIGVGEATIPPIQLFNSVLGLDEAEFLRETKASIKLAIRFDNWRAEGDSYYHTFGAPGRSQAFCHFHHFWTRAQQANHKTNLWEYDLNYLCAEANKFAKLQVNDQVWEMPYAYHFDASLYGKYLRRYSEKLGVIRTEGLIEQVKVDSESGYVTSLVLKNGGEVSGDFFIDCSGARGLLINQKLATGFEDWGTGYPVIVRWQYLRSVLRKLCRTHVPSPIRQAGNGEFRYNIAMAMVWYTVANTTVTMRRNGFSWGISNQTPLPSQKLFRSERVE